MKKGDLFKNKKQKTSGHNLRASSNNASQSGSITVYINPPLQTYVREGIPTKTNSLQVTVAKSTNILTLIQLAYRHFGLQDLPQDTIYCLHKTCRPISGTLISYSTTGLDSVLSKDNLDVSMTLGVAGIPHGSRLFLVKKVLSTSPIRVAFQVMDSSNVNNVPDTGRVIINAQSNWTLWQTIQKVDSDLGTNLASSYNKSKQFQLPKLLYQNAEFSEVDQLLSVRLGSLLSSSLSATSASNPRNPRYGGKIQSNPSTSSDSIMFRISFTSVESDIAEYLEKSNTVFSALDIEEKTKGIQIQEEEEEATNEPEACFDKILPETLEMPKEVQEPLMDIDDIKSEIKKDDSDKPLDLDINSLTLQVLVPDNRELPDSFYTLNSSDMDSIQPRKSALDTSFKIREKKITPSREKLEAESYKIKIIFPCGTFIIFENIVGGDTIYKIVNAISQRFSYLPPMSIMFAGPPTLTLSESKINLQDGSLLWTYPSEKFNSSTKLVDLKRGSQFALRLILGDISSIPQKKSDPAYVESRLKLVDLKKKAWLGFDKLSNEQSNIKVIKEEIKYDDQKLYQESNEEITDNKNVSSEPQIVGGSFAESSTKSEKKKLPKWFKPLGK